MKSFSALIFDKNKDKNDIVAITDENGTRNTTWNELCTHAFMVAEYALDKGIDGIIPLHMERSAEAYETMLGLNLAGIGVAPLSITTPYERCKYISHEVKNAIWTQETYDNAIKYISEKKQMSVDWNERITDNISLDEYNNGTAYVVFTSGSTGNPKGVILSNKAIIGGMMRAAGADFFGYDEKDIALQSASLSFIAVAADLLAPLWAGCTVHILPEEARRDNNLISQYINKHNITTLFMSPQLYRTFEGGPSLKCVCIGGDRIINIAPKGHRLVSVYGMTEMAGFAFHYDIDEAATFTPIGTPSVGIKEYVVDENGNLSDEGELCVSGSVAHEYLNMPELNAKAFTKNPFTNEPGHELLLHSGDIVKKVKKGGYLYLNRKDNMLKVNGQRVEVGEIEINLENYDGINTAAVKGFSDDEGRSFICAYYTCTKDIDEDAVKEYLGQLLPSYMIPRIFVRLDKMPLNSNGKLDRKTLKMPDLSDFRNEYKAPESTEEKIICEGFQKALHIAKVGIKDDFFRLGGDSIGALTVVRECEALGISTTDIFNGKTPEMIALNLKKVHHNIYGELQADKSKVALTDSQMGIFLECISEPESTMYNIPVHITAPNENNLTISAIKEKIDSVIKLHPALYSHIASEDETVYMVRDAFPENGICVVSENLTKIVNPFDLSCGPLCRIFASCTTDKIEIFMDMHHIVSDGTSTNILCRQFCESFSGVAPSEERIDAFSLSEAETKIIDTKEHEDAKKYYDMLLSDVETDCDLIPDYKSKEKGIHPAKRHTIKLDIPEIKEKLKKTDITENTLFMGAFGYTLAKMLGREEGVFAVVENGRKSSLLDNTVSMLVRTLPVVIRLDEEKPGREYLRLLQNQFFNSMNNDSISFGNLCREYGISSNILFVYQSDLISGCTEDNINYEIEVLETGNAFAKLNASVLKINDGYELRIEYQNDLYSKETVERFATLYQFVVSQLLDDIPMKEIVLISEKEKALLDSFCKNESIYNKNETIVDVFKRVAKKYPGKTALVFRDKKYTYAQVDELTNRLSVYIHSLGIGKEQTVAVLIPRCELMMILSLGIIKAGAIYEPLDPGYPSERLNFMCKDADAKLLIAERELVSIVSEYNGIILYTDEISSTLEKINLDEACNIELPSPEDTYILLYTSGTTGTPKGCMLCHKNLMAFVNAHSKTLQLDENSKLALYASYGFDAHMADLYPAIANGCELHIIPEEIRLDFPRLKDYCENNEISHMTMTTQVAHQFAIEYSKIKGMKCIGTGGEKLLPFTPPDNYRFFNLYGPTECTVCVTRFLVDKEYDNIPIGSAMENTHIVVVDSFGRRVPCGVPGELIISGPQVGKGYLNREEQTAKVFVENTFEDNPGKDYLRCYKTGDIVRFLSDGNIDFIGRHDLQVKIRGFRIELSEVEKVIREYPEITDATVIVAEEKGGKCIYAYIVSPNKVDISDLNRFIKKRKPSYMVPAATMQIDRIPLNVNQKVDKRKLPKIIKSSDNDGENLTRSLTKLEEDMFDVLNEIVGNGNLGVETEFSDMGITSITSIKLATQFYKKFGVHITSKDILDGGTVLSVENKIISQLMAHSTLEETEKKKERLKSYPLTQTQLGIYLDCMRAGMDAYNIPVLYKLPENTNVQKLKNAVKEAVKKHPSMLCHIYADQNGDVAIYPMPDMEIEVKEETVDSLPPTPVCFEFGQSPLFNFRIIKNNKEYYLFIEMHHIISDGTSLTILLEDIDKCYKDEELKLEEYTIFDLAIDEQMSRNGKDIAVAKEYYDSVFKGCSVDYLPEADRNSNTECKTFNYTIGASLKVIESFCQKNKITQNVFFTGVFALTLAKYTAHEDALFATIYNGRTDPRTENLVGMLVKTLPIYIGVEPETTVKEFLADLDNRLKKIKKYDIFSFGDAAREYGVNADVMFIYQGKMMSSAVLNGMKMEPISLKNESPKAEISAELFEDIHSLRLTVEYNGGHYSEEWIESFADAYEVCIGSIMSADKLSDIEILSEKAFHKFDDFNDTYVDIPYRPVYRMIEEEAALHPDRIAVVSISENQEKDNKNIYEKLTYCQFDRMTNQLARELSSKGIAPGSVVGIITRRTKEIYISEIGIWKAGCVFLFLSPTYPDDRISYIADDCELQGIVTTHTIAEEKKELLKNLSLPVIFADDIDVNTDAGSLNTYVEPDTLAYLIYTSGSTGKPKGVMVTQKGLLNTVNINPKNIHISNYYTPVVAAVTSFTFDASIIDGVCSLANGMTVCIASDEEIHNPLEFRRMCLENHVTGFVGTPSFVMSLLDLPDFSDVIKQMESIVVGGEAFPPSLYEKLREYNPSLRIVNGYGPSETTVACTAKLLNSSENITIGTPLNNYKIYIIDKQNHILPMGALGELVILGDGVGKGYIKRDDLTKKAFITLLNEPAYKSGDLSLISHDGEIEFHGRIDNQIKLRGLRVELGEIENAINSCEGVKNSIVTVNGEDNNKYLAAYFTAEREIDSSEIISRISKMLAEYMVPRVFIQLPEMPLTANGKIDKKALPKPTVEIQKREYIAPKNVMEKKLCEAFASALGIEKVGVTDNFFEIGGTSLTATKVAMFALSHGIDITYKDVFMYPTVSKLCALSGTTEGITVDNEFDDDYTSANKALLGNVWKAGDDAGYRPLGNVLITGATGFLGMHILKEFLDHEEGEVYCLLRKGSFTSPELKLMGIYYYYFESSIENQVGKRIHCIDGDITDEGCVNKLKDVPFDTLLNCAACVKHFSNSDILDKVNTEGVRHLVNLCLETGRRLIHVSTISVAGEGVNGSPENDKKIFENELYYGQILENQYIVSKFKAEKILLDAIDKGLDGKVMRAGNLMPRYSDGEFQINYLTNGFMRRLHGYYALGCVPYSELSVELEFSPIDETASAMLKLAKTDCRFTVFHANNTHKVYMSDVIRAMNKSGFEIECVDEITFAEKFNVALGKSDTNNAVGGLIAYMNRDRIKDRYMLGYDNSFTANVLNRIGFNWNITNDDYMVNALKHLNELGFFELEI